MPWSIEQIKNSLSYQMIFLTVAMEYDTIEKLNNLEKLLRPKYWDNKEIEMEVELLLSAALNTDVIDTYHIKWDREDKLLMLSLAIENAKIYLLDYESPSPART